MREPGILGPLFGFEQDGVDGRAAARPWLGAALLAAPRESRGRAQASYDLAPDTITSDQLIPVIMRETSIELGAERHAFELVPPPKVDVFPGGRWTASPRADVPREYWTAFRRAVRRLQHEVEIVREHSPNPAV